MTEEEWPQCEEAALMLEFLKGKASDRKLRLFACGCCRAVWESLPLDRCRQAVELAERYADGLVLENELSRARELASNAAHGHLQRYRYKLTNCDGPTDQEGRLLFVAEAAHLHTPFLIGRLRWLARDSELKSLSPWLLRCVFGNPFRPVSPGPWITPAAVLVARDIYDRRDFSALPLLADLLEEAGCPEQSVLDHCRTPGEHTRGCWVVDLVLGKS
jgi:hypothetical protein